jgi:hypothetical protein
MSNSEKELLTDIKKHLDHSVDNLDGATRSRLNRMRFQALDQSNPQPSPIRFWLWAGGATLPAVVLGFFIFLGPASHQAHLEQTPQVAALPVEETAPHYEVATMTSLPGEIDNDALKILMSEEELEMFTDLDFLTWFDNDEVGG